MTRFCTECGSSIKEEEQFCPSCGAKFISTPPVEIQQSSVVTRVNPKQSQPVWKKVVYSLLILIVAICVGGHFFIKSITSPEKSIQPIYNALLNNDEKTLFEKITVPKKVDYDAQSYIAYINDQDMNLFLQTLTQNASSVHNDGITRIIEHGDGSELLRLKADKFLYFYPVVKVIPSSSDVTLVTDLKDATFSFNKKDFPLDGDSIKIGSFLPGNYPVTATSKGQFVPHSADWSVSVNTVKDSNEISLMKIDTMIVLDGEEPDSIVHVNGLSTKKTIAELKSIGPVFGETKFDLHVEKKTPTGEVATSHLEVSTGGSESYFSFPSNLSFEEKTSTEIAEENFDKQGLENFVLGFRDSYSQALTEQNFGLISPYLAPDSVAYKELVDFIGDLGDDYYHYDFTLNEVTETEVFENEAFVSMYEEFTFTNHKDDVTHYERDKKYNILLSDDGDFRIHNIDIIDTKRNR